MFGILRRKSTNFIINEVNLPVFFGEIGDKITHKRWNLDK